MNAAVMTELLPNLRSLKLSAMVAQLEMHLRQAREDKEDYEEFLLNLTELEVATRMENGRKRRIKAAKFPLLKPLQTFKFEAAPDLDTRLIKELSNGQYIKEARNVIFLGRSGTGKTHLATALGMGAAAVRVGFEDSVYYAAGKAAATNAELVEKIVALIHQIGLEVATPSEARDLLGLKQL